MKLFENREYLGSKNDTLSFLNLNEAHKAVSKSNGAVSPWVKNPIFSSSNVTLYGGDACTILRTLPDESINCIITSPPYYGLRRYDAGPKEIGQESTIAEYINNLVSVFREARRVLRDDGTCFIVISDGYAKMKNLMLTGVFIEDSPATGRTQGYSVLAPMNELVRRSASLYLACR